MLLILKGKKCRKWCMSVCTVALIILTTIYLYVHLPSNNNISSHKVRKIHHSLIPVTTTERTHHPHSLNVSTWLDSHIRLKESSPSIPTCPKGLVLNGDDVVFEKLTFCANASFPMLFPPSLEVWRYRKEFVCDSNLVIFHKWAALLRDVIIDTGCISRYEHNVKLKHGFFKIKGPCKQATESDLRFIGAEFNHLNRWFRSIEPIQVFPYSVTFSVTFTLCVKRYEYHNIYHTLSDIYNAFQVTKFFDLDPLLINILFLDANPVDHLLSLWENIFRSVSTLPALKNNTLYGYKALFWNKVGYDSELLDFSAKSLPFVEEFREFILKAHSISLKIKKSACNRPLSVLMISRSDYMNRTISRQIANEQELFRVIIQNSSLNVRPSVVSLEALPPKNQLELVSKTDILVGMHGAGLVHTLFLPPNAVLVELLPSYLVQATGHFEGIARWRQLSYLKWVNRDPKYERKLGVSTYVPAEVMTDLLWKAKQAICNRAT